MRRFILGLVVLVWLVPGANADNGVLEINAACVSVGCFSGDDPDWPVEITEPGSYVLTSNLIVPNENTDGIYVNSPSVSIDLNGFEIVRFGCEGATANCTPTSGTGSGIRSDYSTSFGISVKNGSITGMGLDGISLHDHSLPLGRQFEITNVRVRWNRVNGITTGYGSTVSGVTAFQNGGDGISVDIGSTVSGNTATKNGDDGIFADGASTVSGNTTYWNGGDGIFAYVASTVSGNTAFDNGRAGIVASSGSTVSNNTVRGNNAYGLLLSPDAGYRENVITATQGEVTVSSGVNMGNNSCNGNMTCP